MIKIRILLAFLFSFFIVLSLHAQRPFSLPKQFSVSQVIKVGNGEIIQRIFVDGDKIRVEGPTGIQQQINIIRKDKKVIYTLFPEEHIYFEHPVKEETPLYDITPGDPAAKWTLLGTDSLQGVSCDKYLMESKAGKATFWIVKDTGAPLQIMPEKGNILVVWKDYKVGPQPEDLFVIPSGYQQIENYSIDQEEKTQELPQGNSKPIIPSSPHNAQ
ncbi:DUF4412 domain-containing protein [Methylacidiphilum caldifontis]|uniref:DUF4412 domain-containing protein n=1 Tax=Methylacidiphilum caldifontis TaxID=2795386 RepID=A0A4Y8PB30_9BACT|nr:DUF4412 domain-containing protein [Methylacidiphilum caldifontis]QSR88154.1 DUF4412 domain-containing protein [Methylacidiphilum caldifontis]TFE68193.1 hypothetical protein A7Q10_00705 [Methylacidiphilum caldifontis]